MDQPSAGCGDGFCNYGLFHSLAAASLVFTPQAVGLSLVVSLSAHCCSWRRRGSERPDSDFMMGAVNSATPTPDGRRSPDRDSTTASDTPGADRYAPADRAFAQRRLRKS